MKRYAVCLQKKSFTGSTGVLWEFVGAKSFLNEVEVAFSIKPKAVAGVKENGGPVAFCATLVVIWDCDTWSDDYIPIVEAWANGDLQLRSAE